MTTSGPAREAWLEMVALFTGEENQQSFLTAAASLALTPSAFRALLGFGDEEAPAMRELAEKWHCDPSYVTGIVDQLEQRGFAERRPHRSDRRVKIVSLTEAGASARQAAKLRLSEPPAALRSLSVADARALRDLLRKATAALPV